MVRPAQPLVAIFVVLTAAVLVAMAGCGSKNNGDSGDNGFGDDGGGQTFGMDSGGSSGSSGGVLSSSGGGGPLFDPGDGGPGANMCPAGSPLSCYVNTMCANGAKTTITGHVYDPAGKNPLQSVVVFIPNDVTTLPTITPGSGHCSCSSCDT